MHGQMPIKINRHSVGHDPRSSSHPDDTNIFEEDTSLKIHNSLQGVVKQKHLIHDIPPRGHVKVNITKSNNLKIWKFFNNPAKNWKIERDALEKNGPDHPDVESVVGEVPAKSHDGVHVPNPDGEVTTDDGVAFFCKVPFLIQSINLTRSLVSILSMDGNGHRACSSILDPHQLRKGEQHRIQRIGLSIFKWRNFGTGKSRKKTRFDKKLNIWKKDKEKRNLLVHSSKALFSSNSLRMRQRKDMWHTNSVHWMVCRMKTTSMCLADSFVHPVKSRKNYVKKSEEEKNKQN